MYFDFEIDPQRGKLHHVQLMTEEFEDTDKLHRLAEQYYIKNPVTDFVKRVKAGAYNYLSDKDYLCLLSFYKQFSQKMFQNPDEDGKDVTEVNMFQFMVNLMRAYLEKAAFYDPEDTFSPGETTELLKERGYEQREIVPAITKKATLRSLFDKDTINELSICDQDISRDFSFFAKHDAGLLSLPGAEMEPFIARFVKALNGCGVFTVKSCDGWHERYDADPFRLMRIWMRDRYSLLWFWLIEEFVFGGKWQSDKKLDELCWYDRWEPKLYDAGTSFFEMKEMSSRDNKRFLMAYRITAGKEREAYRKINHCAVWLENIDGPMKFIRRDWIKRLQTLYGSDEAIEGADLSELYERSRRIVEGSMNNRRIRFEPAGICPDNNSPVHGWDFLDD